MNNDVITLVAEQYAVDEYGDAVKTKTERTIFAECRSITQTEFYQAAAAGMKPEIKFVIADFADYHGEKVLMYQPYGGKLRRYNVIRTYRAGNALEITCNSEVNADAGA